MRRTILLALLSSVFSPAFACPKNPSHCRCRPADPCWPSATEWQALNATLGGHLQTVRPVASVCHDPAFDAAACAAVTSSTHDSTWRAAEPGALQWTNWEARPAANQSCYVDTARGVPCGQGRVSLFSAAARGPADVQAAVRFARAHDLRLAVKNSGHCFLGRSSAPESLQIATHAMDSIVFADSFVPEGGHASAGPAVTVGAGVLLKPLYDAVAERNVTVVAGSSHTVGIVGGYLQGGGHSLLGTWKGMAADNALEFTVVDAEGNLVVANQYQHTDLFWALRGGGGGTFGVVVSATVRIFPEVPVITAQIDFFTSNTTGFWQALEIFHEQLPSINDAGGSGYYFVTPAATPGNISITSVAFFFANVSDVGYVNRTVGPAVDGISALLGNASVVYQPYFAPESKYVFASILNGTADTTGSVARSGSRLISHDFLASPDGPARLSAALQQITEIMSVGFTGHVVAGGQVARNKDTVDSALNPAWRRTLSHITFGVSWASDAPVEVQQAQTSLLTNQLVPLLKALEPDMGAYLNEADADEVDFQQSFWGANYRRLLDLKKKMDPRGLFITRRGVGSEEWDEDGLCRAST